MMMKFALGSSSDAVVLSKEQQQVLEMHWNFCNLAKVVLCWLTSKDVFYVMDALQKLSRIIMVFILQHVYHIQKGCSEWQDTFLWLF